MKNVIKSVTLFAALSAISGAALAASSATNENTLKGTVLKLCVMPSAAPQTVDVIGAGAVNPTDGTVDAVTLLNVSYNNSMCNYKAYLGVKTKNGGLTKGNILGNALPSPATGFVNRIDYKASADWAGLLSGDLITNGTPAAKVEAQDTDTGQIGTLTVKIETSDGTSPVEEGYYEDVLTVGIGAQL